MKTPVLAILALATISAGSELDSFKVQYGTPESGVGFNDMPWTVSEAIAQRKWVKIDEDQRLNVEVYSQPGDPHIMLLFDRHGNIAGIRAGYLKDEVDAQAKKNGIPYTYEYDNISAFSRAFYFNKHLWHQTVLFASPSKLASGGRRKKLTKGLHDIAESVWFKQDGKWTEISRSECSTSTDFEEQACYPGMGKHYYYRLNAQKGCERRLHFFALYNEGRLNAFGFGTYAAFKANPKTQSYRDVLPTNLEIIKDPPACVIQYFRNFGVQLTHVYLKGDPTKITCPATDWRSQHC